MPENVFEVVLDEIGDLLTVVGTAIGATPAGLVLRVVGVVAHDAAGGMHELNAAELERAKQAAELGEAAGRSAYEASKRAGK